jgi:hypothetical protein
MWLKGAKITLANPNTGLTFACQVIWLDWICTFETIKVRKVVELVQIHR